MTVHVMAKRPRLAALLCTRVFVMRETQADRAPEKHGHVNGETGPVQGKGRGGPAFRSSVIPASSNQSHKMKEAERRQTLGTTAASCDAARALLERARLTAFHHGSHLREYLIPKAQLQARLPGTRSERALPAFACPSPGSTSRPGHRAGGLIPKPPGSGLQIRPRAPHPLHLTACLR